MAHMPVGHYLSRAQRAEYIAINFAPYLSGHILDVGCGQALLRKHLDNYVGIDIVGQPDLITNLESGGLPFKERAFDTVVCTDVLEHLDSMHRVLADLFRVSARYVIISLPNAYALGWRLKFLRGQVIAVEYSLTPQNRHKWLPNLNEIKSFLPAQLPQGWHIAWEFGYYPPAWWRVGPIYKFLAQTFPNLLATTYWGVLERRV